MVVGLLIESSIVIVCEDIHEVHVAVSKEKSADGECRAGQLAAGRDRIRGIKKRLIVNDPTRQVRGVVDGRACI